MCGGYLHPSVLTYRLLGSYSMKDQRPEAVDHGSLRQGEYLTPISSDLTSITNWYRYDDAINFMLLQIGLARFLIAPDTCMFSGRSRIDPIPQTIVRSRDHIQVPVPHQVSVQQYFFWCPPSREHGPLLSLRPRELHLDDETLCWFSQLRYSISDSHRVLRSIQGFCKPFNEWCH